MQSDFRTFCKEARERIPVPAIPLAAIRNAAENAAASKAQRRWTRPIAAALASISLAAAAAGAAVWNSTHVTLDRSGSVQLSAKRLAFAKNPTAENLRSAARQADFPVVLPAGLPPGTTLAMLTKAGSSALLLQYNLPGAWRRSNHLLGIVLANPKTLGGAAKSVREDYQMQLGGMAGNAGAHWRIGREDVILLRSTLTPAELAHIKSAMIAQSQRAGALR